MTDNNIITSKSPRSYKKVISPILKTKYGLKK